MPRPFRLPLDGPVLSAALGSIAAVGAMVVTLQGLLLGADSATYLAAARGARLDPWTLLHPPSGTDLTLRGHFPPAYSALVALVGGPGGARVLGVVLAAVTVTLLCEIVRRHAGAGAALVAGALLICTRDHLLVMFGFLQSDGLHLAATTATVACALAALPTTEPRTTEPRTTGAHLTGAHHPDAGRRRALAAVAMFGAIATLTRYTGIGVLVGAAAALVHGRGVRVRSALLTIAVGLAPLIVWTAIVAGSGEWSSRRVGWTRVGLDPWAAIDGLILSYAPAAILDGIPGVASRSVALVSFVAICWWSAHAIRRGASPIATLLIVAWSYLAVIVASRLTLDRNIVLHGRFIIPLADPPAGITRHRGRAPLPPVADVATRRDTRHGRRTAAQRHHPVRPHVARTDRCVVERPAGGHERAAQAPPTTPARPGGRHERGGVGLPRHRQANRAPAGSDRPLRLDSQPRLRDGARRHDPRRPTGRRGRPRPRTVRGSRRPPPPRRSRRRRP